MGPFEVAALAIIAVFGSRIITTWLQANRGGTAAQQKIQEWEHRLQALEGIQQNPKGLQGLQERVHVLEEIVTTDDFELRQKFRQLEAEKEET
jgi:hypothetical protein